MSIGADQLRQQLGLGADDSFALSESDKLTFQENERYSQLMRHMSGFLVQVIKDNADRFYEVPSQLSGNQVHTLALVSPYTKFEGRDEEDDPSLVRLLITHQYISGDSVYMECNDFIASGLSSAISWRRQRVDIRHDGDEKYSWPCGPSDVPKVLLRHRNAYADDGGANVDVHVGTEYEKEPFTLYGTSKVEAAEGLRTHSSLLISSAKVAINDKRIFAHQSNV